MILIFDGECVICSEWVKFVMKHDRKGTLRFASTQGKTGRALLEKAGLDPDKLETLLLVDGEKTWQQTAAMFRVLDYLGGRWKLAWSLWLIPAPLRNAVYGYSARNRYRLYGKRETCFLPRPEDRARFLD